MTDLLIKYTTDASRFLVIDGVLIHYRDEGKGFPLVLIHGSFSSLHTFNDWVKILKTDYRLIRFDLPGFGLSGNNPKRNYDMKYFLRFLGRFLKMMKIEKCHLIGSSLGGWLAWEYCLKSPEQIEKLVLIDSAGFLTKKNLPTPIKMFQTRFLKNLVKMAIKRHILEQYVREVYADQSKVTDFLVDRYFDLFSRDGNPEAFFKLVNSKQIDNSKKLKYIQQETLILWGELDEWLAVNNAYRFKINIPNAKLIVYPDLGHIPMEENPEKTAMDLKLFLKS